MEEHKDGDIIIDDFFADLRKLAEEIEEKKKKEKAS